MTVPITFLEPARNLRLAKTITQEGGTPYPLAKTFTSHTHFIAPNPQGLDEAFALMQSHALKGHCIHRGVLKEPLISESRRNKADKNAPTNLLVIDLDDFIPETPLVAPISSATLAAVVEPIRQLLPAPLNSTACIANASASTGMKPNGAIGLHLFFLLERPVSTAQLTHWLTGLNFQVEPFKRQLKLNRSGISVKWVCDPTMARPAQLVYIAPPELVGVTDPFVSPADRWALLPGERATCDITQLLLDTLPSAVQQQSERILADLRKSAGLKRLNPQYRALTIDGEKVQVLTNPDQLQLELIRTSEKFAYWNVNGGDSGAYYNPIGNPEVIYNFKGEPPFELRKANEDIYNWYCEKYKAQIRDTSDPRPLAFREINSDQHYAVEFNPRDDRVLRIAKIQKQNLADWFASYGVPVPDPIPQWDVLFDPSTTLVIDWDNQRLNLFQPTDLLRNPPAIFPAYAGKKLGEAKAALEQLCPLIHRVLFHICGNGEPEYEWFINWLAFLVQTRKKVETTWVFSGVPGTGKGVFFNRILRPLLGEKYTTKKRLDHLEEQFNAYLQHTLLLVYEEFRLSDSKQDGKLLNKLKDEIGGVTTNIRAMRTDVAEVANYTNYLFFSNHQDVIRIEDGDRRFNIAPPQRVPLRAIWPTITEDMERLDGELGTFAGFLMAYQANQNAARTCIENDAKQRMKTLALGYNERFCLAVRHGELDFFLEVLELDVANDLSRSVQITTAQKYVRAWASKVGGSPARVTAKELFTVYLALHDARITQPKFTQMLARNDVPVQRAKVNGEKTTCVDIQWFSNLDHEELTAISTPGPKPAHANFH